eukprot:c18544_g2_i2 orf=276-764(+)
MLAYKTQYRVPKLPPLFPQKRSFEFSQPIQKARRYFIHKHTLLAIVLRGSLQRHIFPPIPIQPTTRVQKNSLRIRRATHCRGKLLRHSNASKCTNLQSPNIKQTQKSSSSTNSTNPNREHQTSSLHQISQCHSPSFGTSSPLPISLSHSCFFFFLCVCEKNK